MKTPFALLRLLLAPVGLKVLEAESPDQAIAVGRSLELVDRVLEVSHGETRLLERSPLGFHARLENFSQGPASAETGRRGGIEWSVAATHGTGAPPRAGRGGAPLEGDSSRLIHDAAAAGAAAEGGLTLGAEGCCIRDLAVEGIAVLLP